MITFTRRRRHTVRSSATEHERFLWQFELILEGARRAERPFSMTQFTCRSESEAAKLQQLCLEMTRACDAVGIERSNVLVIWDSTATAPATRAARRLLAKFSEVVEAQCKVSTVGFPNAGYTPTALIRALVRAPADPPPDEPPGRVTSTPNTRDPLERLAG
jgi:hypothetical protein